MSNMTDRCLVLNARWQAASTTTVANAFVLLYRQAAKFVDVKNYSTYSFEEWITYSSERPSKGQIFTPTLRLEKPEVIILTRFAGKVKGRVSLNLRNVARRDNHMCMYCGKDIYYEEKSIDHVIPRSKNGKTSWSNCVLACFRCNNVKGNKTVAEAGFTLLTEPRRPEWLPFHENGIFPQSWLAFLQPDQLK